MEKIKSLFKSKPKLMIGAVVVLALSLPFVINQVLKQQDVRQRADSAPAITFNWSNPIQTIHVGDTLTLGLKLNAGTNDIGALHFKLNYTKGFAGNVTTSIAGPYKAIQQDNQNDGVMELTLINPDNFKVTGSNQDVMKFEFKALKTGYFMLTMDEVQATASLFNTYVPIDNAGNIVAKITIVDVGVDTTISPTVPNTTSPIPTPVCKTGANTVGVSEPCGDGLNRRVNFVCYDGTVGASGDSTSCKTFAAWKAYADTVCASHGNNGYCQGGSPTPTPTRTTANCTDTDGGLNYNVKGTITSKYSDGTPYTASDSCYNGSSTLIEYTCQLTGQGNNNVSFVCPNGCSDGACLPPVLPTGKYCRSNADCSSGYYCPALPADATNYPSPIFVCELISWAITPTQAVAATPTPTPSPTFIPTPWPTATPIPVPTIGSDQTGLKVSLSLPGIGTKTNLGENNNPHRKTRVATAIVLDSSNTPVTTEKTGVLTYNSTNGLYEGFISLDSSIATQSGSYLVKLKMDNTLYKRATGIVTITKLKADNPVPQVELVSGDIAGANNGTDNTLDLLDYNQLGSCYRGSVACTTTFAILADFNDDGVVRGDDIDANILSRGFYIRNGD